MTHTLYVVKFCDGKYLKSILGANRAMNLKDAFWFTDFEVAKQKAKELNGAVIKILLEQLHMNV